MHRSSRSGEAWRVVAADLDIAVLLGGVFASFLGTIDQPALTPSPSSKSKPSSSVQQKHYQKPTAIDDMGCICSTQRAASSTTARNHSDGDVEPPRQQPPREQPPQQQQQQQQALPEGAAVELQVIRFMVTTYPTPMGWPVSVLSIPT